MTAKIEAPARLTAGDSWQWTIKPLWVADSAPGWSVALYLKEQSGEAALMIEGRQEAEAWQFAASASETETLPAGKYSWAVVARQIEAGERATLARGTLAVQPDPLAGGDTRARPERILDAIEATIEGRATKDADAYSIEGRSITRIPIADLLRLRAIYRREVAALRGDKSGGVQYRRVAIK